MEYMDVNGAMVLYSVYQTNNLWETSRGVLSIGGEWPSINASDFDIQGPADVFEHVCLEEG